MLRRPRFPGVRIRLRWCLDACVAVRLPDFEIVTEARWTSICSRITIILDFRFDGTRKFWRFGLLN